MRYDRGLLYYVGDMKDTTVRREVTDIEKFANRILKVQKFSYEGWNFNSGNYLFTTDTK